MGCCFSKRNSTSSPPAPSLSLINGGLSSSSSYSVKPSDPSKTAVETQKPEAESAMTNTVFKGEDEKPRSEKEQQEGEHHENGKVKKEVFVIKHRKSHDRSKTTDPVDSPASATAEEKSTDANPNPAAGVVRTSSCTKEEVDAILIQCGRLSRSNSAAAKTRRYSGSKRSFDFDQNDGSRGYAEEADAEDGGDEEEERRMHRHRHRGGDRGSASPRERRRRTPSREREDSKIYRSGSRERGTGGGSRRVSRSPGRRSETTPNPNPNSNGGVGSSVNSGNNRPGKLVSVPATDKTSLVMDKSNNGEPSVKRITVKRNVGEAHRTVASPRSQSPARTAANVSNNAQPPPSLSRSSSKKAEHSPYRRNPLSEIDTNSLAYQPSKGDKMGSSGNGNCNKKMMVNRENEGQVLIKESGNFMGQKPSNGRVTPQASNCRAASPSRVARERQEMAEECKIASSGIEILKAPEINRSRSLRKSRDFDFSPEALISNNNTTAPAPAPSSYTALLLEDIQNFHQKNVPSSFTLPQCVNKACSIVNAVADLNSTTNNTSPFTDQHQRNEFNFSSCIKKSAAVADLMEPSFEKYVTVKRGGGSLEDMEEQESSGSNSFVSGSSSLVQQKGFSSSSSWEPNSADSTDRWSSRSNKIKERDQSPLGFANCQKKEFDPLKNGMGRSKVAAGNSSSSGKGTMQSRVAAASM